MLSAVKENFPTLFPYISLSYQLQSNLYFGTKSIKSVCGIQQGDPLGPALFALTIHPIVKKVQTEFNCCFIDDVAIGDTPAAVFDTFLQISEEAEKLGLSLNPNKCELFILAGDEQEKNDVAKMFTEVAPGIQVLTTNDAILLGAPLTENSIKKMLNMKTEQFKDFSAKLSKLSSHSAFFLLRASISTPRLVYFLRCAPSFKEDDLLQYYDDALRKVLETILNTTLSDDAWKQSSLPVKMGGLGIRHATDSAIPCFLSSFYSSQPLIRKILPPDISVCDESEDEAKKKWESTEQPVPATLSDQHAWEAPLFQKILDSQIEHSKSKEEKARLLAFSFRHAGDWLNCLPSPQLGTHLDNEVFRVAASIRLGCGICVPHRCPCGEEVTESGLHGLKCKKSAGRHSRHAVMNDILIRALRSANIPSTAEPLGCARQDGKRPDGLTLVPWERGRSLVYDYTCTDTFAPSYLRSTSIVAGSAAKLAEEKKHRKYDFLNDRYIFKAVAQETTGIFGEEGEQLIRAIGKKICLQTGENRSTSFLFQKLSISLQRSNYACVLGTLPVGKGLTELFYL
jgi:hypothetical protein